MPARFLTDPAEAGRAPDIVVAGGGIVGLATAFFLSRAGLRPLVIERLPALAMLASRRSGEGVRAQWELPSNIELARASIDIYAGFEALTGHTAGYRPIGYLYGSRTEAGAGRLAARVDRQREAGLDDVEWLTPEAARDRVPTLSPEVTGAAFRAGDGVIDIGSIITGYLAGMNADIVTDCDLLHIRERVGGVTLETNRGAIDTGSLVLANAVRCPGILASLGVALKLRLSRSAIQYVTLDRVPADHPAVVDADLGSFWRPDTNGARMTASFRSTLFLDRLTDDPPVGADYLQHAIRTVSPLTPFWGERAAEISGGHLRSGSLLVTADGGPLVGRLTGHDRIFVNTGYGGHGVMMSPEAARLLADEATGGAASRWSPARFDDGFMPPAEPMTVNLASNRD
ncbi:NAD(P)/FAD-dependent oxidoreductase [Pelagovum pacificum]|uniref:FAD-binding oxidoreductase n=1 Tax=Pelagovum pacificum TaxID=2588711 RepID=A0A5C5G9D6_9RHOB|nr:FAD-binding oxidoreductase [Pelagovum pacificum]QQA41971.1 FAD-binding oxidoreductase [Pelagovum pacificum]TNY30588.1 FAD-binding oxidoreductase [Pelagovum pacificum]